MVADVINRALKLHVDLQNQNIIIIIQSLVTWNTRAAINYSAHIYENSST